MGYVAEVIGDLEQPRLAGSGQPNLGIEERAMDDQLSAALE